MCFGAIFSKGACDRSEWLVPAFVCLFFSNLYMFCCPFMRMQAAGPFFPLKNTVNFCHRNLEHGPYRASFYNYETLFASIYSLLCLYFTLHSLVSCYIIIVSYSYTSWRILDKQSEVGARSHSLKSPLHVTPADKLNSLSIRTHAQIDRFVYCAVHVHVYVIYMY